MKSNHPIHFVGSIGLEDTHDVFTQLSTIVGDKALYYPDGETGDRHYWVRWQRRVFEDHPGFVAGGERGPLTQGAKSSTQFALSIEPESLHFPPVGYAEAAIASFEIFASLQEQGVIPASVRFQVSLPTPTAVIETFVVPEHRALVQGAYVRAMMQEVADILSHIPKDSLTIQWDICHEIVAHDGGLTIHLVNPLDDSIALLTKLVAPIPETVHLGFHLCYGDPGHKHIIEPEDLTTSVTFANAICGGMPRRCDFVHMAVPRNRIDEAYFLPLRQLRSNGARLILGLVHHTDGIEGTRARIETASKFATSFGVATECGFGRRPASTIPELLRIHAQVAD